MTTFRRSVKGLRNLDCMSLNLNMMPADSVLWLVLKEYQATKLSNRH